MLILTHKTIAYIRMINTHKVISTNNTRRVQSTIATIDLVQVVIGSTENMFFMHRCNWHKQQTNDTGNAQLAAIMIMWNKECDC